MLALALTAEVLLTNQVKEAPFKLGDDAIIVDVVVNGRPASLMFDTGYGGSVILDDRLQIGKPTGEITLVDFVGSFTASTVKLSSLKVGEVEMPVDGQEVVQQPAEHYTSSYGTHCDGILGLEAMSHSVFTISYEKQKFLFHPSSLDITTWKPDNTKTFLLKLLPTGNDSIQLAAETGMGKKLYLALDTGNSGYAVTHTEVLVRTGLWESGKKPNFMGTSFVASGPVDSYSIKLDGLKIFGVPVASSIWNIIDLPPSKADHDGTVGHGFLKNFNITIDMARRRVWLENWTGEVANEPVGEVGVRVFEDTKSKRMRVWKVTPGSPADKAGVKAGDFVLGIDGVDIGPMSARTLTRQLEGPVGSKLNLALSNKGNLYRVEIERAYLVN